MVRLHCKECNETLRQTGRNTLFCPSCDVCPECGSLDAVDDWHNEGCPYVKDEEKHG